MTDGFGGRLRRERERQQITLADLAARTKIKASLFDELERDNVSHWPPGIFRRAFIRAYADQLGLDADAVVREFLQRYPDPLATPEPAAPGCRPTAPAHELARQPHQLAGQRESTHNLRLTLVETGLPFTGGRLLADARRRWAAAAWDLGSLVAIALSLFMLTDSFWMPFGVTALCYYVGGILVLGNSPGVCLFAPSPPGNGDGNAKASRARQPPVDASPVSLPSH